MALAQNTDKAVDVASVPGGAGSVTRGAGRPRVLLADDHLLIAEAFVQLLAPECDIVGTVRDGRALVAEAQRLRPDVVVLDIMMPLLNGLDAAREVKRLLPRTRIVCVTMSEDPEMSKQAFRAGASAFLLKSSAASELLTAVRAVISGRSYITPRATQDLVDVCVSRPLNRQTGEALTPRQREILRLVATGHSMKDVAAILKITPRTVAFHKYQMMTRLRVKSTAELIQFAVKRHLAGVLLMIGSAATP